MGLGLGFILGGALQGAGTGIAQQATADAEQRRQIALLELRQKQAVELDGVQTGNAMKRDVGQNDLAVSRDQKQTENQDWADSRKTVRDTSATITIDNNRTGNESKLNKQKFEQEQVLKSIDLSNDIQLTKVKSALDLAGDKQRAAYIKGLESGDVVDTVESGDGKIYGLRKDGSRIDLGIPAKTEASGGSALDQARQGGGAQTPPKPEQKPQQQPTSQKGKYPVAKSDAEAESIMNNPRNAGKVFIGPDGKLYKVPSK